MARFLSSVISGSTIVLDGNEYIGCTFQSCRIVVTRGNFSLKNCVFDGCKFEFGGEAENIRSLVLRLLNQTSETPALAGTKGE
jgi:hypothetical protein